jgi:dTDP-glucose 4,6-dehydratase
MNAASAYGEGKRLVEQMCALTPEVETVVARCFSFIGPHLPLDARFAAGNFLRDAIAGGPIVVQGDGTAERSYLYAADLVVWLLTLLLKGKPRRAYNVGSEESITVLELARRVATRKGSRGEVLVAGAGRSSPTASPSAYVPDIARARDEFGLATWIDLNEALTRTMAWQRGAIESPAR